MESDCRSHYAKHFNELIEREKEAAEKYDDLKGYRTDCYKGEIKLSESQFILYSISDGNPLNSDELKHRIKRTLILNYYYQIRVEKLNELLAAIDQLKHIEETSKQK